MHWQHADEGLEELAHSGAHPPVDRRRRQASAVFHLLQPNEPQLPPRIGLRSIKFFHEIHAPGTKIDQIAIGAGLAPVGQGQVAVGKFLDMLGEHPCYEARGSDRPARTKVADAFAQGFV